MSEGSSYHGPSPCDTSGELDSLKPRSVVIFGTNLFPPAGDLDRILLALLAPCAAAICLPLKEKLRRLVCHLTELLCAVITLVSGDCDEAIPQVRLRAIGLPEWDSLKTGSGWDACATRRRCQLCPACLAGEGLQQLCLPCNPPKLVSLVIALRRELQ